MSLFGAEAGRKADADSPALRPACPPQELQHRIANFAQERDKLVKAAKDKIVVAKKAAEAAKKALKSKQTALQVGLCSCSSSWCSSAESGRMRTSNLTCCPCLAGTSGSRLDDQGSPG